MNLCNLISIKQLNKSQIFDILELAYSYENTNIKPKINKILINIFLEPSTRTSLSFTTAMYKLNGNVITFNKESSSLNKGETIEDTIKTLSLFGDILVLRSDDTNLIHNLVNQINIPIINGGNGNDGHPTQALLDIYTMYKYFKNKIIDCTLNILIIGDIDDSRTIHSLLEILELINLKSITFYSFKNKNQKKLYDKCYKYIDNFSNIDHKQYDVVYITRRQKEREIEDIITDETFIFNNELARKFHKNCIFMHPLPRNNELSTELDSDNRSKYFEQIKNGVYVRMALIYKILINQTF